jgi:hypothetical protein
MVSGGNKIFVAPNRIIVRMEVAGTGRLIILTEEAQEKIHERNI